MKSKSIKQKNDFKFNFTLKSGCLQLVRPVRDFFLIPIVHTWTLFKVDQLIILNALLLFI